MDGIISKNVEDQQGEGSEPHKSGDEDSSELARQDDRLSSLPFDILVRICSFLDEPSLMNLGQTCRRWRGLVEEYLWRKKTNNGFIFQRLLQSKQAEEDDRSISLKWTKICVKKWRDPQAAIRFLQYSFMSAFCLCPSIDWLLLGSRFHLVKILPSKKGCLEHPFLGHDAPIECADIDQHRVVTGSQDATLRLWDASSGTCKQVFRGHRDTVSCVQIHQTRLASGSSDTTIRMWDINSGSCIFSIHFFHTQPNLFIDDSYLIMSADSRLEVWNIKKEVKILAFNEAPSRPIVFDGCRLVIGMGGWDWPEVWNVRTIEREHILNTRPNSVKRSGHLVAVYILFESLVDIFDVISGVICTEIVTGAPIVSLDFHVDILITLCVNDKISFWSIPDGNLIREIPTEVKIVPGCEIHFSGQEEKAACQDLSEATLCKINK